MKKTKQNKRSWFKKIAFGLSLTTVAFIFQACYGVPQDFGNDRMISGNIIDKNGKPIKGIKIEISSMLQYSMSNENGYFYMYVPIMESYTMKFVEEKDNKIYEEKDTTVIAKDRQKLHLDIQLNNK